MPLDEIQCKRIDKEITSTQKVRVLGRTRMCSGKTFQDKYRETLAGLDAIHSGKSAAAFVHPASFLSILYSRVTAPFHTRGHTAKTALERQSSVQLVAL